MDDKPKTIATVLAAAQLELTDPPRSSFNPHFKSKYADLCTVLQAVRPTLAKHGIAITQSTRVEDDGRMLLVTRLSWCDEEIVGYYPVTPQQNTPQGLGAALTYARRYALASMVGVAADDDRDGEEAAKAPKKSDKVARDEAADLAAFIAKVKACNDIEELRTWRADAARIGAAATAALNARGAALKAAAEAP
jgi:hypothetical protein